MKQALMAFIIGCVLAAGAASVQCADIVGSVRDANGDAVPGVKVTTSTTDGQTVGSAVTDGQGSYAINNLTTGLHYLTLIPPPGSNLNGQSVAGYVGGSGLTVNWGVAPGREPLASAMPGVTGGGAETTASAAQFGSDPPSPPPICSSSNFDCIPCCILFPKDPRCIPNKSNKRECLSN